MNCVKISEAEYPLMEYIWENAPISASALAAYSQDAFHWKKNQETDPQRRSGKTGTGLYRNSSGYQTAGSAVRAGKSVQPHFRRLLQRYASLLHFQRVD